MKKTTVAIINILSSIFMALMPFFFAQANQQITNSVNEHDSIYQYNALENKISFNNLSKNIPVSSFSNVENLAELKLNKLQNDVIKELDSIIEKQNFSIQEVDNFMNSFKDNSVKTFFIGTDLGKLKFQLVQIQGQTSLLNALALKDQGNLNKVRIDSQIKFSKMEQKKVEDFISEKEKEFSLFGWVVDIL